MKYMDWLESIFNAILAVFITGVVIALILVAVYFISGFNVLVFLGLMKNDNEPPQQPVEQAQQPVEQPQQPVEQPLLQPKYMGCYGDYIWNNNDKRVFPTMAGILNLQQCNEEAKKIGSTHFGLQFFEDTGGQPNKGTAYDTAQCWIGNEFAFDRDGPAGNDHTNFNGSDSCPVLGTATYPRGGGWTNAVYKTV